MWLMMTKAEVNPGGEHFYHEPDEGGYIRVAYIDSEKITLIDVLRQGKLHLGYVDADGVYAVFKGELSELKAAKLASERALEGLTLGR